MRTTTQTLGTVASLTAAMNLAPCLMIPCRSTAVPIMKPGTSARKSRGISKASQSQMKRAALSAESAKRTPPFTRGWLAIMPTTLPFIRPNPVMISGANLFFTSQKEPASIN